MDRYLSAKEIYAKYGIDTENAINTLQNVPISIHCWQGDDVNGFEKKEGEGKAFTIVNQQDWVEPMDSNIKMKIEGKVTKYYDGVPVVMTANNGVYEFNLAQGDGMFVTVE